MSEDKRTGAEEVRWDLSCLYNGLDDPQLDADVAALVAMAANFKAAYKGNLASQLGPAISSYSEIVMLNYKVSAYLELRSSLDKHDDAVKAKIAEVQSAQAAAFGEHLEFFTIELVSLSEETVASLCAKYYLVENHLPWIKMQRLDKPHMLSEEVESALSKRDQFGSDSWSEFYGEVEAELRFPFAGEEKTLEEITHVVNHHEDAETRAAALKALNDGLKGPFAKYAARTLYEIAGAKAVEDRERKYPHPMTARNLENMIPDAVVEALHTAVVTNGALLAKRYYRLKAALLDMRTLRWSDRNAPLPLEDTRLIPWNEALATVLAAYESFSPDLAALIRESVRAKRIDASAVPGKASGAFNYSVVLPGYKAASFTLVNYLGSARDVSTLAHELGHSIHGLLAANAQGPLMFEAPIAYAETASIFGEMTTFKYMKESLARGWNKSAVLALIVDKVDNIINSVVRQIGFSNFERRLHGAKTRLSVSELNAIWMETVRELYGEDGEVFTYEDMDHLWAYIGHFHSPFYVYGYACGELLTHCLYAQRERLGKDFERKYLQLLRAGGTKNALELLAPFGLDPTNPDFWTEGISLSLGALVEKAEELAVELY